MVNRISEPILDQRVEGFFSSVMSKTGFSTTSLAITAALSLGGFALHKFDNYRSGLKKYDEGYAQALEDIAEGQEDLDTQNEGFIGEFEGFTAEVDEEIETIEEDYENENDKAVSGIKVSIDEHGRAIAKLQSREKNDWGSNPVPNDTRLRFKRRDDERKRRSGGGREPDDKAIDSSRALGATGSNGETRGNR